MAIRIYRYRPPEIQVTLTSGGTLSSGTTYYIASYFNKHWTYINTGSIFSNVVPITTDGVNRSISLYWKVTVPIQGFESGGAGKIRVKSTNHCLAAANTLIIEDGIYAGTYTVATWENYNSFLINGTYVSDYSSTFRVETTHNAMNGMIVYMSTTAPFSGDPTKGTWTGTTTTFSHTPWGNGYTTNNISITAPPTSALYGNIPQYQGTTYKPGPWCKVMEKGKIWVDMSGTETVANLRQSFIDADVTDVAYIEGSTFVIYGILRATGVNCISFTDMNISCYWGMIGGASNFNEITYTRCNFQLLEDDYGAYLGATANNSNFMFEIKGLRTGYVYKYPVGSNNSFNSNVGIGAEGMGNNFTVTNMVVNANNGRWQVDCSNNTRKYINCRINSGFVYIYYVNTPPVDGWYILDGFYIDSPQIYDISMNYQNTYNLRLRNIDTNRTNNRKMLYCISSNPTPITVYFYRSGSIIVTDKDGNVISGATINIKSDSTTEYNYTTNSGGTISYEILEQISAPPTGVGFFNTTFIENWIIRVTKDGYNTYQSKCISAKDIESKISLNITPDPIYIEEKIGGMIDTSSFTGVVTSGDLTGIIISDDLVGNLD